MAALAYPKARKLALPAKARLLGARDSGGGLPPGQYIGGSKARNGTGGVGYYNFDKALVTGQLRDYLRAPADKPYLALGDSNTAGLHSDGTAQGKRILAVPDRMGVRLNSDAVVTANVDAVVGSNGFTTTYISNYSTKVSYSGLWGANGLVSVGGNTFSRTAGTSAAWFFSPAVTTFNKVDVYVIDSGTDQFTIESPSGTVRQTVTLTNTGAVLKFTNDAGGGANNVAIRSAGAIQLVSVSTYTAGSGKLRIFNAGRNSFTSADLIVATNAYSVLNAFPVFTPGAVEVQIMINDINTSVPPATSKANVIAECSAIVAAGAVPILVVPVRIDETGRPDENLYQDAMYDVADAGGYPLMDRAAFLGSYASAVANGLMFDGLHPSQTGYNNLGIFQATGLELIAA